MKTAEKKILFVIPTFAIGGISSSLYSLISSIDRSRIDVSVFCRNWVGPMKEPFARCCKILPENKWLSLMIHEGSTLKRVLCYILGGFRNLFRRIGINLNPLYSRIGCHQLGFLDYDVLISFHEDMVSIACHYPAKHKIAWIHCDYSKRLEMNGKDELKEYSFFDEIVCVSDYARSVFCEIYPSLVDRTLFIHNVLDVENICKRANATNEIDEHFDTNQFNIVSIGRLDPVKQFSVIPAIAAKIKELSSIPFKWYIIGGSRGIETEKTTIEKSIEEFHVGNEVILLGEKTNVYPYLKKSDLYVCTSISESFPLVINEAKALGIPVISNAFPSVKESINEGKDGYITTIEDMPNVISSLLQKPLAKTSAHIDNSISINKFYKIIGL